MSWQDLGDFEIDGRPFRLMDTQRRASGSRVSWPRRCRSAPSTRVDGGARPYEDAVGFRRTAPLQVARRRPDPRGEPRRCARRCISRYRSSGSAGLHHAASTGRSSRSTCSGRSPTSSSSSSTRTSREVWWTATHRSPSTFVATSCARPGSASTSLFSAPRCCAPTTRGARCALCDTVYCLTPPLSSRIVRKRVAAVATAWALCTIHHAAYDCHVLGVRPDLVVEIRADLLEEVDGPMLEHGLKGRHGQRLMVLPAMRAERPDPELLDRRYREFRAATA